MPIGDRRILTLGPVPRLRVKRLRERAKERKMVKVRVAALLLAAGLVVLPALAQDAKKTEAPKPALGASQSVLESWNDIRKIDLY